MPNKKEQNRKINLRGRRDFDYKGTPEMKRKEPIRGNVMKKSIQIAQQIQEERKMGPGSLVRIKPGTKKKPRKNPRPPLPNNL